jgi:deoxyribodipyrimidine photolyase
MSYGLVWFKRDFRLAEHGALAAAPAAAQLDLGF